MRPGSIQLKIVLPAAGLVFAVMLTVLAAALIIGADVSEDYEEYLISQRAAPVEQIVKTSLSQLVTAGLLDRGDVTEALQKTTLRELATAWDRHGVSGVVVAQGKPAFSTIPPALLPLVLEKGEHGGVFHFYRGLQYVNGVTLAVPAWGWRVTTVSGPMPVPLLKHNNTLVFFLIPLVTAASFFILGGILLVLHRNLQRPLAAILRGIADGRHLPTVGVREVDEIGSAINTAFEILRMRNEQLRQSEEHYRTLTEGAQDLIFEINPDLTLRYINRYAAHHFLSDPEQMAGRALPDLLPERSRAAVRLDLEEVLRRGESASVEWPVAFPTGEVWWNTRLIPLRVADGGIASILGIARDLTERKRAEAALETEKERLAVTLRSIGEGVVTCDLRGRVLLVNRVAEELTGAAQADAQGQPFGTVFSPEDSKASRALAADIKHLLGMGWAVGLPRRVILLNPRGERRLVEVSGAPIRDTESKVIGVVLILRDLTEEQRREEEIRRGQRLESLGLLAGGIAHDFNNILTGILGNISLAEMMVREDPRLARTLGEVERAALRAGSLTRQLLTFSRGGAPVKSIFNLEALLREAADFALHGSNVRLSFTLPDDLWWVEADEGQISQVVNNLVINAVQAMPQGGAIQIAAENYLVPPADLPLDPGRYVKVAVADTGTGIDPAHLKRIFEPYFTTKVAGTGLGLATSYSIIHRHGGHITVSSTVGQGTVFTFALPAVGRKSAPEGAASRQSLGGHGKILVMDDEEIIRSLAGEMLSTLGYVPVCVCSGEEAIREYREAMASTSPYDAIILDLTIPGGMGAKDAVRTLRELDPGVRAIVSSGYSNDPVLANHREYGFSGALTKPFRIEDLDGVLRSVRRV